MHVDHLSVRGSGGTGVVVERGAAFDDSSQELDIRGSGATQPAVGYAARIATPAIASLPRGRYAGNAIDSVVIDTQAPITTADTFRDRGVPYLTSGSVVVRPEVADGLATLTIQPGVTLKFPKDQGLIVGGGSSSSPAIPGRVIAEGTAERPIVFTSGEATPAAGDWRGLYFMGYQPTGNKISHATVEYAGASCLCSTGGCAGAEEAGIMFFTYPLEQPVVSQTTFAHIAGHGIYTNFHSDATNLDMTSDNSFDDVSGCAQTMIVSTSGTCARECM